MISRKDAASAEYERCSLIESDRDKKAANNK